GLGEFTDRRAAGGHCTMTNGDAVVAIDRGVGTDGHCIGAVHGVACAHDGGTGGIGPASHGVIGAHDLDIVAPTGSVSAVDRIVVAEHEAVIAIDDIRVTDGIGAVAIHGVTSTEGAAIVAGYRVACPDHRGAGAVRHRIKADGDRVVAGRGGVVAH